MAIQAQQQHYLDALGLRPGATMDEVHTAYYLLIEKLSANPTEDEADEHQKLQHAYAVLRRSYDEFRGAPRVSARATGDSRKLIATIAVLLVVAIGALVAMNLPEIRLHMTDVEPGTVVRLKDQTVPYGTVLRLDEAHRFHVGEPTPAYEIRLHTTGETVWLSKRVVVKAMVPTPESGTGH